MRKENGGQANKILHAHMPRISGFLQPGDMMVSETMVMLVFLVLASA